MPRQKTLLKVTAAAEDDARTEAATEEGRQQAAEGQADADRAAAESSRGAVVTVLRITEDGREEYCGEYSAKLVDRRFIARRHGGGEYLCKTRIPTGRGQQTKYGSTFRLSIAKEVEPEGSRVGPSEGEALSLHQTLSRLVEQQMESARAVNEMTLATAKAVRDGRQVDWAALGTVLGPVLVALVEGMFSRRSPDPFKQAMEFVRLMQEHAPEAPATGDLTDIVSKYRELQEVFQDATGKVPEGSQAFEAISRGLSLLEKWVPAASGQRAPLPDGARVADIPADDSNGAPVEVSPMAVAEVPEDAALWAREVLAALAKYGRFASRVPPRAAADILWQNAPVAVLSSFEADVKAAVEADPEHDEGAAVMALVRQVQPFLPDWTVERLEWLAEVLGETAYLVLHPESESDDEAEVATSAGPARPPLPSARNGTQAVDARRPD